VKPRFDVDISKFYVRLSDYEKVKEIGRGAFGGVYSARHKTTGVIVAVKELYPDREDPSQRQAYTREVQMLGTLRHPAILTLHGCTPFDERPAILTPLLAASVQHYVDLEGKGQPATCWTPTQKHIVLLGIAAAMAFMHENRCIHRDLKPANVLLDDECEPHVADFGLSKFVEKGATLAQSIRGGTPQYMAPEIHLGDDFDFKVDVYAYSMIMFVVLTGLDPFPNIKNQLVLARRVANGDRPTIPNYIAKPYADLMRRCWETAPASRPDFADIVSALGEDDVLAEVDIDPVKDYQARVCSPDHVPATSVRFVEAQRRAPRAVVARVPIEELRRLADGGDGRSQVQFGAKLEAGDGIAKDLAGAVRYYRMAADAGDGDGMVALGRCLRKGIGVPQDVRAGFSLFKLAADRGLPDGQYWVAESLAYGIGCFRDPAEAARQYRLAADAGHGLAASGFGEAIERGNGVACDIAEAVRYYRMSSDLACPEGMFNLGDMYQHGKHIGQDVPEAIRLYKLAADENIENAFWALCEIYKKGHGPVQANLELAVQAAKASADRGHFRGLVELAGLIEEGAGIERDPARAKALFERAHSKQYSADQNNYAFSLEFGKGCVAQPALAVKYYQIAANNGCAMAMKNLGTCYDNGTGIAKDSAAAARWYKAGADAGCASACACYGEDLRVGDGVPVDYVEARKYLVKGAEMEDRSCYGHLGLMCKNGEGCEVDYAGAFKWLTRAAEKGLPWAIAELGILYDEGKGVAANPAKAAEWYRKGLAFGNRNAIERLGHLYRTGRGVALDLAEARKLFQKAQSLGSPTAAAISSLG
jgi:TPR repeat protein